MHITFMPDAEENARLYATSDRPLWDQITPVLAALEADQSIPYQRILRYRGHRAHFVVIRVPGRDDDYDLMWVPNGDGEALVVYVGRSI